MTSSKVNAIPTASTSALHTLPHVENIPTNPPAGFKSSRHPHAVRRANLRTRSLNLRISLSLSSLSLVMHVGDNNSIGY